MPKKHPTYQPPSIDISFNQQTKEINNKDQRLQMQILRVHSIEKQRIVSKIWNLNQQQLCQYFTSYDLFPQSYFTFQLLLESPHLKLIKSQGKIYFGQIHRKHRHGWGIQIDRSGQIYEGQFAGNQKRGKAIEIYLNGNLYVGEFINNKKHGKGTFYWFNLSKPQSQIEYYQGQWWGGLPDGSGIHSRCNGDLFTGTFKNGLKHGQGEQRYGNGDYYRGEYINGLPQGYGEYFWSDGSSYCGDFKQGLRAGYGGWKAGRDRLESYQGHYTADKKTGYGIYTWDNGWVFKGNFQNDFRNGYGQLFDSQNIVSFRGQWENGNRAGKQSPRYEYQPQNPEHSHLHSPSHIPLESHFKSTPPSRKESSHRLPSAQQYQSAQVYNHYNRQDIGQYATLSHFAQQNLCRRPQMFSSTRNSFESKTARPKGHIGTKISRPLAPGPSSIASRRAISTKKF